MADSGEAMLRDWGHQARDTDVGHETLIAQGSVTRIMSFRHHPHPHIGPDDEVFRDPTVIFTTQWTWHIRSDGKWHDVHPEVVVLRALGQRHGYRERAWETRGGTVELRMRDDSSFPSLLNPARRRG